MYIKGERSMAWIAKIDEVIKHPEADSLDICTVGGWKCVTKFGEFKKGELVVYCSIDSWIPNEIAPFLSKNKEPRDYNGVKGERLRTIKLRGQVSQGLILPLEPTCSMIESLLFEGLDVSLPLNIQKWEAPIPACLAGKVKGNFPSFIPKTDQERIQNLKKEFDSYKQYTFEVTEKLDGSSCTVYYNKGIFGVCSRNLDLEFDDVNTFWKACNQYDLQNKLKELKLNIALQGELIGEGIQGNKYNITGHQFHLFDVYNIDQGKYHSSSFRQTLSKTLGIPHAPIIDKEFSIDEKSIEDILIFAEGKSMLNESTEREGLVFKCVENTDISFKGISNCFLLKSGD